ncbi:hypothetical protein LIN78_05120 [Leeia sp. TBRC 13508]|uniref:Uncharacterized protein n=1 Tax=Leeia speluncae TaxID=2884804 RepID=A0ABS8D5N3_9NEIS|nr:hypothetical protein [Leeia speluncae]MCB6182928.1 hypothetical protein [Leeia speluncae]
MNLLILPFGILGKSTVSLTNQENALIMLHEERKTYETLKSWALENYFDGCRDHAVMNGWPHEQIMGYVIYQFEDGFERPIENLMWQVILLVLSGGWHAEWVIQQRQIIFDCIEEHGLDALLAEVPKEEAQTFKHDLKILKFV